MWRLPDISGSHWVANCGVRTRKRWPSTSTLSRPVSYLWADDSCGGLRSSLRMWAGVVVPWLMARILLVAGMLANILSYHQAWLFGSLMVLLCRTAGTALKVAIHPSPAGGPRGRGS